MTRHKLRLAHHPRLSYPDPSWVSCAVVLNVEAVEGVKGDALCLLSCWQRWSNTPVGTCNERLDEVRASLMQYNFRNLAVK